MKTIATTTNIKNIEIKLLGELSINNLAQQLANCVEDVKFRDAKKLNYSLWDEGYHIGVVTIKRK